jgi:hypothetical protein
MNERLERDYRRLMTLYPAAFRHEYGEEMIGVLMEHAGPNQRRPSLADLADLLKSGLAARFRLLGHARPDDSWREAASVLGTVVAVALLTLTVRSTVHALASQASFSTLPDIWLARGIGWAAVVLLLIVGARPLAAATGFLIVAAEAVLHIREPLDDALSDLYAARPMLAGLVAALALSVPTARRRVFAVFGTRGAAVVLSGAAVIALIDLAEFIWWPPMRYFDGASSGGPPAVTVGTYRISYVLLPFYLAVLVAAGWVAYRLSRPTLRRLLVLVAPLVTFHLLIERMFNGYLFGSPVYATSAAELSAYWLTIALLPALVFGLGVGLLRRHERRLRLIALSRQATAAPADPTEPPTP